MKAAGRRGCLAVVSTILLALVCSGPRDFGKTVPAARDTGEVVSAGFGMGTMELVVKLRGAGGLPALEDALRAAYPGAKYRVGRGGR